MTAETSSTSSSGETILDSIAEAPADHYRVLKISDLDGDKLCELSQFMKLSLSKEDMLAVQEIYKEWGREPTDVELEVIAQTWSEHCKHRIFGATIEHEVDGEKETVNSLFKTYIFDVSHRIFDSKPGFVLSAFHDNAGFIKLDDEQAVCLKAETHNHPSAIEPYAGANTGLGGVIRDILGAGKGAKPIGSLDVFCFGAPDTGMENIKADDVLHPLGIMRGVVRGVRDYGNRMGIPTISGAIQFDDSYIYNPLVYCGTAGVIPIKDIDKEVGAGMTVIAVGGRTGRDGLHGATFSSAALDTESHEEDQQAVQIGNPIEEKKAADFVLAARDKGLIEFITDCGAGGYSSAAGEMLEECGGTINLDNVTLKEPGMVSWEIFISESQERMVLAVKPESLPALQELADLYETEMIVLGDADGSGILKVTHHGETVCQLDCSKLHDAPIRKLSSKWEKKTKEIEPPLLSNAGESLKGLLSDFAIVSREPIIREYDHEVQGNTVLKPLAGASGDAPQDATVLRINGSKRLMSMGLSILPEWGKTDPFAMGAACVDECVRQLVASGADPDRLAILDNFCMGNPDDTEELGALVETVKGIAEAAEVYGAPFVSGKDSFYNYFETEEGPVSIPVTILISGIGIIEEASHVTGSSLRRNDSVLAIIGHTQSQLGGSVLARQTGLENAEVPATDLEQAFASYRKYYEAIQQGLILSAHDVSEGGLAVTLAEAAFSGKAGLEIDLCSLPMDDDASKAAMLFGESPSRIVVEVAPENLEKLSDLFEGLPFACLGRAAAEHSSLRIEWGKETLINEPIEELKSLWKNGLAQYY
ncbi:MAG: phosphoribosylformylglycinamidine synthase subunit PurL [Verrucomicrobiales bacterium]|nr:phosphoribosylformylglycinamidine synthase subunit PurL [Verrucomicrobiales bacterium]